MCLTRASCFCSVHGKAAGEAGQEGGEGLQGRAGQSEEGEPAPRPGRAPHFCGFGRVVLVSSFRVRCAPRLRPRVFSQEPAQGVQWHLPASLPTKGVQSKRTVFCLCFFHGTSVLFIHFQSTEHAFFTNCVGCGLPAIPTTTLSLPALFLA